MSIVSSYFSSRKSTFRINAQVASLMDSIFAIGLGLGVRFIVDLVSHHDVKLTGTLVGLWEGIVMQHFLKKMPRSFDPYVAYGVRLFIDFLVTESIARLVLVLVWTGMGVILADVAPALWVDVGMRRIWRRFRRDLYVISKSVPSVPLFTRPRTVRFSPSRTGSVLTMTPPSVFTATTQDPTRLSPPTPAPPALRKRPVPGAFPDDVSETETTISIHSDTSTNPGATQHRFSKFNRYRATFYTETEVSSGFNDLDEGNLSSSDDSYLTETVDPSAANPSEIPDYDEEEELRTMRRDKGKKREDYDGDTTPRRKAMNFPPTPSDSALATRQNPYVPEEVQPPVAEVPNIPDQLDDDWENISRRDAVPTPPPGRNEDVPPTPPAKDNALHRPQSPSPPPQPVPPPSDNLRSFAADQTTVREEPFPRFTVNPVVDLLDMESTVLSAPGQTGAPDASSQQTTDLGAQPPALSSTDDLFATGRHENRTPPPAFQDIYNQEQPNSKPASLLTLNANLVTDEPNLLDTNDNHATQDAASQVISTEPTNDTNANEQTNIEYTGTAAVEQQQTEGQPPAETAGSAVVDTQPPPPPAPPTPTVSVKSDIPEQSALLLEQALQLRRQAIELDQKIEGLKKNPGPLLDAAEAEMKKVKGKISRRLVAVSELSDHTGPPRDNKIDLTDTASSDLAGRLEPVLTKLVLRNQPSLSISTTKLQKVKMAKITALLDQYSIVYKGTGKLAIVTLPTSS